MLITVREAQRLIFNLVLLLLLLLLLLLPPLVLLQFRSSPVGELW